MDENQFPPYPHPSPSEPSTRPTQSEHKQEETDINCPRPGTGNPALSPTLSTPPLNVNNWKSSACQSQPNQNVSYASNPTPVKATQEWLTDTNPTLDGRSRDTDDSFAGPSRAFQSTPSSPPSLLTNEPLSRSSVSPNLPSINTFQSTTSTLPQSVDPIASVLPSKRKRTRSASLPIAGTFPKRQKTVRLRLPLPSVLQRPNTPITPNTAKVASGSTIPPIPPHIPRPGQSQIIIASRVPPINNNSLRTLDATEIMKCPQLRHDLLFDALAFRPIYPTSASSRGEWFEV